MNLERKVRIKQYAPAAFARIRALAGISDVQLLASMDPSANVK